MKTFLLSSLIAVSCFNSSFAIPKPLPNATGDSIIVHKNITNRSHKFFLYPDAAQKILFFNVRGNSGKVYQLYVFNMDGKMVKQAEIRNKQTTLINNIEKGTYLFEVFSDDDRIGNGQIAVR